MDQIECVVIGAGVVGLAVARALAARGREVIVLEAAEAIGVGTSSRNSEVIHAGIYYPRGSLKATLCVRGREMLYDYCVERNVPHSRCGKLLVATSNNQIPQLDSIMAKGRDNGVLDLMRITGGRGAGARTGARMRGGRVLAADRHCRQSSVDAGACRGDAERDGVMFAFPLAGRGNRSGQWPLHHQGRRRRRATISAACVINSAGLRANALARKIRGLDAPRAAALPRARQLLQHLRTRAV